MINNDRRTERRRIGDIGETIACDFLKSRGFHIIERNYLRKWGEIDIVAEKAGVVHFVEVKSVNHETLGSIRPEENMHRGKIQRLMRTIETYLLHKKLNSEFQLDLVTVKMHTETRRAKIELFENIVV
jgi:putative endonuclease